MTWLEQRHPEYAAQVGRWQYTRDHYSGEVLSTGTIDRYLVRKTLGETREAYLERANLADYTPHFATVVDSLAGMLHANEDDAVREWADDAGNGLGDAADPDTPAGKLVLDADGQGRGWLTLLKSLSTELLLMRRAWGVVDSDEARVFARLLPAEAVVNWLAGPTGLSEVLVRESRDVRESLEDEREPVETFIRYTTTGWTRYRLENGRVAVVAGDAGSGVYQFRSRSGAPALPIFPITLPIGRNVGYILARKANAIFNRESERDHLLRVANFPRLCLDVTSDEAFKAIVTELAQGSNILPGAGHKYAAPPSEPAAIATEVIKRKVEEFYIVAFREYGDAARERTATEVRQDVSAGVGALLTLLNGAVEDAEREWMWRLEQAQYPTRPGMWWQSRVERSNEFALQNIDASIEKTRTWYFGQSGTLPIGRTAQIAVAQQAAAYSGVEVDEAEVAAAVDLANLERAAELLRDIGIPDSARDQLVLQVLRATGVVAPSQGATTLDAAALLASMTEASQAKQLEDQQRRAALGQAAGA